MAAPRARALRWISFAGIVLAGSCLRPPIGPGQDRHDVVIRGGRVLDPERGTDLVATIGIRGGTITTIGDAPLRGRIEIDARGLAVAPGFVDLLSYDPIEPGVWNKLADGVTTALSMHGGTASPGAWYAATARLRPPLHYGASFFYTQARRRFQPDRYAAVPPGALPALARLAAAALDEGALGISFSLEYVPGVGAEEIVPLMELAARRGVPVFFHLRYSDPDEPGTGLEGLAEVLGYARQTGAAVHIDHLHSTGGTFTMPEAIAMIDAARAEGLDVTACVYPYAYWGTYLDSARFDPGWQARFRIGHGDLQLAGSSERLTPESFERYRRRGKLVVAYAIPEDDVRTALVAPYVFIGSDAILEPGHNNHPRASGAYARTLGLYAREAAVVPLLDAVAKVTLLPARRLEASCPAMRRKGRLQPGMDADLVVFDPARVRDRATVEHPERFSDGIVYVLVDGRIVKDPRGLRRAARHGRAIRRPTR